MFPLIHSRAVAWLGLASPQAALDVLRIESGALAEVTAFPLDPLLSALGLPPRL